MEDFAKRERYCINPSKSNVLCYKNTSKGAIHEPKYFMTGNELRKASTTMHLGIQRSTTNTPDIEGKISLARKAAYALMGAGFHSGNGLKHETCARLWISEVVPRLIYGLEVMDLRAKGITELELFQRKNMKQLQGLPSKTPNSISIAMLGLLPVESAVHKNMLSLFGNIIRNKDSV
ncbi:MAG: hypothetical protein ABW185_27255 [Sedimenticola sp.]